MQRWEHCIVDAHDDDEEEETIARMGEGGWELVAVRKRLGEGWRNSYHEATRFYFKRPKE